jgi:hypothetical protein
VILGFHTKQLSERGTEVALFDYADAAQTMLGHEVRVYVPADASVILPGVARRFASMFELTLYRSTSEISCDALYVIKRGRRSSVQNRVPELNHAFYEVDEPHGHRFAAISEWLARRGANTVRLPRGRRLRLPRIRSVPFVPHIVHPPTTDDDMRRDLDIPDDAVVFGRHGAADAFSLEFVKRAVLRTVESRCDVWFVFLNTDPFAEHDRIVHVPRVDDREDISRFVNSCDYMIHAVANGENFGLAVAEFAVAGVPVLTYLGSPSLAHLDLLGPGLRMGYASYGEVLAAFSTLGRRTSPVPSDLASRFSPDAVMRRFSAVFLN